MDEELINLNREQLAERYKEPVGALVKYGKFRILASSVKPTSIRKMDPTANTLAQRNTFLSDSNKSGQRKELKKWLEEWHTLLSSSDDIGELRSKADESIEKATTLINTNIKKALEETRELERSYRSIQTFFKNANTDQIENLTMVNASIDQLADPDFDLFRNAIKEELKDKYATLGKAENYSLMVIPGYLGSSKNLREWADMANEYKALLITDFSDLTDYLSLKDDFNAEGFESMPNMENVMMLCNWMIARKKDETVGELEDLVIPPSAGVAGKMYDPSILISQPIAGKRYGQINNVDGVRLKLYQEQIGELDKIGLIPMTLEWKQVMPFSARSMNGTDDDTGLRTYSVVRSFDWAAKVIADFLNQTAFETATQARLEDLRSQISKFLNSITGKIIDGFAIQKFERDQEQPDRILVHITMKPMFPSKTFLLKLDGTDGGDFNDYKWDDV